MSPAFNAEEILEVAVHIEQTGAAYYRRAASFQKNPAAKRMLEELADMEDGHELLFENLRADPETLSELLGDPDGEIAQYLQAFADGKVFPKESAEVTAIGPDTDLDDVLSHAITMELKSIAFYQGFKDAMGKDNRRDKLSTIIAEERHHVTALSRHLAAIRAQRAKHQPS